MERKKGFNRRLIDLIDEHYKTSHFYLIIIKLLFFLKNFLLLSIWLLCILLIKYVICLVFFLKN